MQMIGKPNAVINRFGNVYKADAKGMIEVKTEDEVKLMLAYGFSPVKPVTEVVENQEEVVVPVTEVV